ncbi:hypothetical protein [Streptomyces sp. NRRL S-920]|uniref:hypothetical protein n=1 Tax=Streptomyces sp. NRRL S-920 TaxID=1463921 RepID=UPI0004C80EBC|nr:hypothetical protein [Streptomyces sp. NRRL S-920]
MPITLPLARHYYETRREVLAAGGEHVTPWYRLTPDERAVAVTEAVIILEAVRRANAEHAALLGVALDDADSTAGPDVAQV